jgi:hypothetical protein
MEKLESLRAPAGRAHRRASRAAVTVMGSLGFMGSSSLATPVGGFVK